MDQRGKGVQLRVTRGGNRNRTYLKRRGLIDPNRRGECQTSRETGKYDQTDLGGPVKWPELQGHIIPHNGVNRGQGNSFRRPILMRTTMTSRKKERKKRHAGMPSTVSRRGKGELNVKSTSKTFDSGVHGLGCMQEE